MSRNFNNYASLPNCWTSEAKQPRENYFVSYAIRGYNNINKSSNQEKKNEDIKESYDDYYYCNEQCAMNNARCNNSNKDGSECQKEDIKCEYDCYQKEKERKKAGL